MIGKSAKLEFLRRFLLIGLSILGTVVVLALPNPLIGIFCFLAGFGAYTALPRPQLPAGALRPKPPLSVFVTDLIAWLVAVPLFALSLVGVLFSDPRLTPLFLIFLVPASLSFFIMMIAVRQETSWVRFLGNGFEMTQLGLRIRVRYDELAGVVLRVMTTQRGVFASLMSLFERERRLALLESAGETSALVFVTKGGTHFVFSTEMISDLERILIDIDRAGLELPSALSERQRKRIQQRREQLYRNASSGESEQLDKDNIKDIVRKFQEQQETR